MISERTLKKWRRESLEFKGVIIGPMDSFAEMVQVNRQSLIDWHKRILELTQELLDQHLLKRRQ